ncbi:MAG: DUF3754 domain-containing protein, partial [Phycisphaerales bacterium]|nr:DUF3754 domain-containing protein [Phycisphaerales bacterium]
MNESLPDDRFIPVRACDLLDAVATDDDIGFAEMREIGDLCRHLVEQEAGALERAIEATYAPSNPDRETILLGAPRADADALHRSLRYLLDKANFEVLDDIGIADAPDAARARGVRVRLRPDRIESMTLAVRGRTSRMRHVRDARHPLKGTWQEEQIYRRLVVVSRLKDDVAIHLKLFREIPLADLEALLPHAEVRMNWVDRAKVAGGGVGVVGATALKISKVLVSIATISKLLWIVGPALG